MDRLLIGSRNKLLIWDGKPRPILEKQRYYVYHHFYGITWDTKTIYVAHRLAHKHGVIQFFDNEFNWKKSLSFKVAFEAPHQILWWDGKLYMTDARRGRVLIWDGKNTRVITWKKERADQDSLHSNSIWCDGKEFYVLEHSGHKMPKGVQVFDLDFNPTRHIILPEEVLIRSQRRHHGIHNVYIENGILHVFVPGALVRYDLVSGDSNRIVPHKLMKGHYARGLARVPGKFFIGLSEVKSRFERDVGDSHIIVTDDNFKALDVLRLKDTGALHEIRAIDRLDLAHNKIRCPLLYGKKIHYDQKQVWQK